ncbi:hypothetical protein BKA81DRAFT_179733 [Phyllosticta paracitricarpa]
MQVRCIMRCVALRGTTTTTTTTTSARYEEQRNACDPALSCHVSFLSDGAVINTRPLVASQADCCSLLVSQMIGVASMYMCLGVPATAPAASHPEAAACTQPSGNGLGLLCARFFNLAVPLVELNVQYIALHNYSTGKRTRCCCCINAGCRRSPAVELPAAGCDACTPCAESGG